MMKLFETICGCAVVLLAVTVLGCSRQGADDLAEEKEPCLGFPSNEDTGFGSIAFFESWGPCYNENECWRRMGVMHDSTLVLEDGVGAAVVNITEEELASIRELGEAKETWDFIAIGHCDGHYEGLHTEVELRLKNGTIMGHDQANGCRAKEPEEPISYLYRAVETLGKKYFPCPAGYEYSIDDQSFFVPSNDARALCAWRYDK